MVTREFGEPTEQPGLWEANDPSRHAGKVRTPMLVIHGDKDYRVPIGNALYQWWDLTRNQVEAKFLYFPDENHWILRPGNSQAWYETVLAFLAQHVLGQPLGQDRRLAQRAVIACGRRRSPATGSSTWLPAPVRRASPSPTAARPSCRATSRSACCRSASRPSARTLPFTAGDGTQLALRRRRLRRRHHLLRAAQHRRPRGRPPRVCAASTRPPAAASSWSAPGRPARRPPFTLPRPGSTCWCWKSRGSRGRRSAATDLPPARSRPWWAWASASASRTAGCGTRACASSARASDWNCPGPSCPATRGTA